MAFCTKCGAQMSDDTNFCPVCGTRRVDTASAPTPVAPAVPKKRASNVSFATRMRQFILKNNTLFLIGLVCMALSALLSFVGSVDLFGFKTGTLISLAVSAVPVVAIFLLWLESSKTTAFSDLGLMIIKYMSIAYIVLAGIGALISIIAVDEFFELLMDFTVGAGSSVSQSAIESVKDTLTVSCLIICGLFAGYYALIMTHTNKHLKALKTNETPSASGGLVVVLWILAGFSVLTALAGLDDNFSTMLMLGNLAGAGSSVIFALLATKAKKEL